MQAFYNHNGDVTGYLVEKLILNEKARHVIGIILGDIVYGRDGEPVGKYLQHVVYNSDGYKVARLSEDSILTSVNNYMAQIRDEGWEIIKHITNHYAHWLRLKEEWSPQPLEDILTPTHTAAVV
jgi:hypothetical protein